MAVALLCVNTSAEEQWLGLHFVWELWVIRQASGQNCSNIPQKFCLIEVDMSELWIWEWQRHKASCKNMLAYFTYKYYNSHLVKLVKYWKQAHH